MKKKELNNKCAILIYYNIINKYLYKRYSFNNFINCFDVCLGFDMHACGLGFLVNPSCFAVLPCFLFVTVGSHCSLIRFSLVVRFLELLKFFSRRFRSSLSSFFEHDLVCPLLMLFLRSFCLFKWFIPCAPTLGSAWAARLFQVPRS